MDNNIDAAEIERFSTLAQHWWDPHGPCKPLHGLNPTRLDYVLQHTDLNQKSILDIGCGGGILSEAMAKKGGNVTALDMSAELIQTAKQHAEQEALNIQYVHTHLESFTEKNTTRYDIITCMELLEHVPSPQCLLAHAATQLKPDGYLFVSTINKTARAFFVAILGAEHILRLLPKGTHQYERFIRPGTLCHWARSANLSVTETKGIHYNPFKGTSHLNEDVRINYLACLRPTTY